MTKEHKDLKVKINNAYTIGKFFTKEEKELLIKLLTKNEKYNIEEIESIDIQNIFYAILACAMMLLFTFGFIYFATN